MLVWVRRGIYLMIMFYALRPFLWCLWLLRSPVEQLTASQGVFELAVIQEAQTAIIVTQ
jgi:hypothetical protein